MGFFSSIGGTVNDILGGTSSAKKAQQYALQQQAFQNAYNKETMQNLHQWEVEDLKKAGLNPALGYGGNTGGIATGTAGGPQAATGDPISMISTAVGIGNQLAEMGLTSANKAKSDAEKDFVEAQTAEQVAKNPFVKTAKKAEIANIQADTQLKKEEKKFTKERARGYSESTSETKGWGASGGIEIGGKKIGPSGGINKTSAKSHSRSW